MIDFLQIFVEDSADSMQVPGSGQFDDMLVSVSYFIAPAKLHA